MIFLRKIDFLFQKTNMQYRKKMSSKQLSQKKEQVAQSVIQDVSAIFEPQDNSHQQDNNKNVPLDCLIENNDERQDPVLLEQGADELEEALEMAVKTNNPTMLKKILLKKPDIYRRNKNQENIFFLAHHLGERGKEILEILNEYVVKDSKLLNATDLQSVEEALDEGANINLEDVNGYNLLTIAAYHGKKELVELFLEKGFDVNKTSTFGWTALLIAIKKEHYDIVNFLLEKNADTEIETKEGWTALNIAASTGNLDITKRLLEHNLPVDFRKKNRFTPLMIAIEYQKENMIDFLLDNGASLDAKNEDGISPLIFAILCDNTFIVEKLLLKTKSHSLIDFEIKNLAVLTKDLPSKYKNNVVQDFFKHQKTFLFLKLTQAIEEENIEDLELFIEKNRNINYEDSFGWTPLMKAARHNKLSALDFFLGKGADINYQNKEGINVLMMASIYADEKFVAFLLDKGASLNAKNNEGANALMVAVKNGNRPIVELLLNKGVNINQTTHEGINVLMIALCKKHFDITELICSKKRIDPEQLRFTTKSLQTLDFIFKEPLFIALREFKIWLKEKRNTPIDMPLQIECSSSSSSSSTVVKTRSKILFNSDSLEKIKTIEPKNEYDQESLILSSKKGDIEKVKRLLTNGANINETNTVGWTALILASAYGHEHIVQHLILSGADLNMAGQDGWTALMLAVWNNRVDVVKILLENNADVTKRSSSSGSALDIAYRKNNPEMVLLVETFTPKRMHSATNMGSSGFTFFDKNSSSSIDSSSQDTVDKGSTVIPTCKK